MLQVHTVPRWCQQCLLSHSMDLPALTGCPTAQINQPWITIKCHTPCSQVSQPPPQKKNSKRRVTQPLTTVTTILLRVQGGQYGVAQPKWSSGHSLPDWQRLTNSTGHAPLFWKVLFKTQFVSTPQISSNVRPLCYPVTLQQWCILFITILSRASSKSLRKWDK